MPGIERRAKGRRQKGWEIITAGKLCWEYNSRFDMKKGWPGINSSPAFNQELLGIQTVSRVLNPLEPTIAQRIGASYGLDCATL